MYLFSENFHVFLFSIPLFYLSDIVVLGQNLVIVTWVTDVTN